ncbi:MAG: hypothetical protein HY826_08790 [Actinobacteria bacterium]|nr:hypothetical protein [Actinomycetota bacterium]
MNRAPFLPSLPTSLRPRTALVAAVLALSMIGLAACSDDNNALDTGGATLPGGVTLPAGVTIPGITDDCQALYLQFITAMTSAFAPGEAIDYSQVFGDVSSKLPADLQDEFVTLATAFEEYGAILAANNNDPGNAEVLAAIQGLNTPEVQAASAAVQQYFDTTCPTTG